MNGNQDASLGEPPLVQFGLVFRNPQPNDGPGEPSDRSTYAHASKRRDQRPRSDKGP